jgi:hypothetical protein
LPEEIFSGHVIAVLWDFDQTLIPGYQQDPLFKEFGVDKDAFLAEYRALVKHYSRAGVAVTPAAAYLSHFLRYVKAGKFGDLTNEKLREVGSRLEFYEGIPEFLRDSKEMIEEDPKYKRNHIEVEHYIVSGGFRKIIEGSAVAEHVKDIWACEFIEVPAEPGYLAESGYDPEGTVPPSGVISEVGYLIDDLTKTRAIWEINKGVNEPDGVPDVNSTIREALRRVPLRNMIAIADGPTDIPVFSILNKNTGRSVGVWNPNDSEHHERVANLEEEGRVNHSAPAIYTEGSDARYWIEKYIKRVADLIVRDRARTREDEVGPPPGHVD